jgi:hypothetical protein
MICGCFLCCHTLLYLKFNFPNTVSVSIQYCVPLWNNILTSVLKVTFNYALSILYITRVIIHLNPHLHRYMMSYYMPKVLEIKLFEHLSIYNSLVAFPLIYLHYFDFCIAFSHCKVEIFCIYIYWYQCFMYYMSNSNLVILSIKSMLSFTIQFCNVLLEYKLRFNSFWLLCHVFW